MKIADVFPPRSGFVQQKVSADRKKAAAPEPERSRRLRRRESPVLTTSSTLFRRYAPERIRIDRESEASHDLIWLLDKPDIGTQLAFRNYLF